MGIIQFKTVEIISFPLWELCKLPLRETFPVRADEKKQLIIEVLDWRLKVRKFIEFRI